jgi:hypothetical protein
MDNEQIESNHIVTKQTDETDSRVSISLSMQRNLGNYEHCHFSIRYEQACRSDDRAMITEILDKEASQWIARRSHKIDQFLRKRDEDKGQGQNNQGT